MVNGSPAAFAPPNRLTRRNNPPHIPAPSHCPAAIALYNCSLLFSWSSLLCSVGRQYHLLTLIISYAARKIYQKCKNFLQKKDSCVFVSHSCLFHFYLCMFILPSPDTPPWAESSLLQCWPAGRLPSVRRFPAVLPTAMFPACLAVRPVRQALC